MPMRARRLPAAVNIRSSTIIFTVRPIRPRAYTHRCITGHDFDASQQDAIQNTVVGNPGTQIPNHPSAKKKTDNPAIRNRIARALAIS